MEAQYVMWGITLLVQAGMGIALARINSTTNKLNRAEDKRESDVKALQGQLHATAEKLIDERFRGMSHDVRNHVQQFTMTIDSMAKRVESFEERYAEAAQKGPMHQAEMAEAIGGLREYVREKAADKQDFKEMCRDVATFKEQMLRAITGLERQVVTTEDLKKFIQEIRREGR